MGGYRGGPARHPMRDTAGRVRDGVRDGVRDMSELREPGAKTAGRARIARALAAFDARMPRRGRVELGVRRCLIAGDGIASMKDFRLWCYPTRQPRRWMYYSIRRALWKLGAAKIGRARGTGCPAVYRLAPTP
jgi:hypothetical protein